MHYRFILSLGIVSLAVAAGGTLTAADPQYANLAEVHIGGAGMFDYLNVDSAAKRLYVTHGTEVVDTTTHRIYTAAPNFEPGEPSAPPAPAGARGRGPAPIPDTFHVLVFAMK